MSEKLDFESMPVGMSLGTTEMVLDDDLVQERADLVQWEARELIDGLRLAPPGISIYMHPKMRFAKLVNLRAAIWAKSEQEFFGPKKIGSKIFITGRVADKYVKRGRKYVVLEFETTNGNGEIILKSRETAVHIDE